MSEEIKSQGEPVAWAQSPNIKAAPNPDSRYPTKSMRDDKNGYSVPLYTHADPAEVGEIKKHNAELLGEVDTLTAEVERLRAENQSLRKTLPNSTAELVDLRTRLAKRDALLRKALADIEYIQKECSGDVSPGYIGCLVDDVVNLLSASAEPKG